MKKLVLILIVLFVSSSTAYSQFKFGLGVSAGTESGIGDEFTEQKLNFGINLRGKVNLPMKFGVQGGITYFFPTTLIDGIFQHTMTNVQANIDLTYTITHIDKFELYALGGFNYNYFGSKEKGVLSQGDTDKVWEPGFELGAGAIIGKIFIEAKYDFSKIEYQNQNFIYEVRGPQLIGTVGIYF